MNSNFFTSHLTNDLDFKEHLGRARRLKKARGNGNPYSYLSEAMDEERKGWQDVKRDLKEEIRERRTYSIYIEHCKTCTEN